LALVNTNTWNAYNPEFGYSRYVGVTGSETSFELSFLRPNQTTFNLTKQDDEPTAAGYPFGFTSKHLMRGELWVLNWITQAGYRTDAFADLDMHIGIQGIEGYKAIIISTHPEYWSQAMYQHLAAYLNGGGRLLYLGGNGLFDSVTISTDLQKMTCYGG